MIENIDLLAYVKENIAFCRTLVIKVEDIAYLDNRLIEQYYNVTIDDDKTKWRYYMNLNGEYHFTDTLMKVKSLDDNTIIDFTKENLLLHPATKTAYREGGYYYSRLVNEFPYQRDLINGILNPISKEDAIKAKNFSILRYNEKYVNWNEIQLIPDLQKWIDNVAYQSFNTEYKYTDNLMHGALLTHLYSSCLKFILTNRYEKRFTRYAHPFYIWSLLRSKGISPIYKEYLNNKQTMWLFRNIDYVLRNLGKEETFNQLIENLLTERDIPLSKYDMVFDTLDMPDELTPTAKYQTERLNLVERFGLARSLKTISLTMTKEVPEAYDNDRYYDKYLDITNSDTNYGEANNYPIKILESEMTDSTNRQEETLFHVLNSELIYLAKRNLYDIQIDFTEPLTGNSYTTTVSEAIVIWHHLLNIYLGYNDCDNIPEFIYNKALKITPPSVKELMSLSGHPFLEEDWCTDLYKTHIPQYRIISPTAFYNNAFAIFNLKWKHKKMIARFPSIGYYSRRENAVSNMYETGFAKLTNYKKYSELLSKYGIDLEGYTKEDASILMWEIWKKMTGWDQFTHQTVAELQSGLIGLMKFLSSYSVQYVKQTEVQTGFYEGGLDLLTENPINLRSDGPQIETETLDTRIEIPHRVVTDYDLELMYLGYIEENGLEAFAETEGSSNIYSTPLLYPTDIPDETDGDMNLTLDNSYKLRNFEGKLPWDIDNLLPTNSLYNNQQFTKGMIIDKLEGKSKEGPWEVVGFEWVNNGFDNSNIVTEFNNIKVNPYCDFVIENGQVTYKFGSLLSRVGDDVLKLDIKLLNRSTNEKTSLRVDYPIKVKEGLWSVILDIPEAIELNSKFPITNTFTNLDIDGGYSEFEIVVPKELSEWLVIEKGSNGEWEGKFIKRGWPEQLPVTVVTTIKANSSDNEYEVGTKRRYMIGYIPSDRYYDPAKDPDFIPTIYYGESDYNYLSQENFKIIQKKNGWKVTNVEFANTPRNLSQLKSEYQGVENFLSPFMYEKRELKEDSNSYFEYRYMFGANRKGNLTFDIDTTLQHNSGEVLTLRSTFDTVAAEHEFTLDPYIQFPEYFILNEREQTRIFTGGNYPSKRPNLNSQATKVLPLRDPLEGENYTITNGSNTIVDRYYLKSSYIVFNTLLKEDLPFGSIISIYLPTKQNNKYNISIGIYNNFAIKKNRVVDIEHFDEKEIGFKPFNVVDHYAYIRDADKYISKITDNGWYIHSFKLRSDEDKTKYPLLEKLLTTLKGPYPESNLDVSDSSFIGSCRETTQDGYDIIPEGYNCFHGLSALFQEAGEGKLPLKVICQNKFKDNSKFRRTFNYDYDIVIKDNVNELTTDNKYITKTEETLIFNLNGVKFLDHESSTTQYSYYSIYALGKDNYGTTFSKPTFDEQNGVYTINHSDLTKTPNDIYSGINLYIPINKNIYERGDKFSVRTGRTYWFNINYDKEHIVDVPPPFLEDFNISFDNPEWFSHASSHETFYFDKEDRYGWIIEDINCECYNESNESDYIITKWNNVKQSNLYKSYPREEYIDENGVSKYKKSLTFTPIKEGTYTINLTLTLSNKHNSDIQYLTLPYEINAKSHNLNIEIYHPSYDDIYYHTPATMRLYKRITGVDDNSNLSIIECDFSTEQFGYVQTISNVNNNFMFNLKKNPGDVNLWYYAAIAENNVVDNLYEVTYSKETHLYLNKDKLDNSKFVPDSEINLDIFELAPDISFNEYRMYEVQTERWRYKKLYKGLNINSIYLLVYPSYLLSRFEYDSEAYTIGILQSVTFGINYDFDVSNVAPEGYNYAFFKFGFNKAGSNALTYNVTINCPYSNYKKDLELVITRNTIDGGIDFKFLHDKPLVIGEKNNVIPNKVKIPYPGYEEGLTSYDHRYHFLGRDSGFMSVEEDRKLNIQAGHSGGNNMVVYYDLQRYSLNTSHTQFKIYAVPSIIESNEYANKYDYFVPTADLLYNEYQPYEEKTERYIVQLSNDEYAFKYVTPHDSMYDYNNEDIFLGFSPNKKETSPSINLVAHPTDDNLKYVYVTFCPRRAGKIKLMFNVILTNKVTGEDETFIWELTKNVSERVSQIKLLNLPDIPVNTEVTVNLNFENVPYPNYHYLDLGSCNASSIDGQYPNETLKYYLYGRHIKISLSNDRDRDARYCIYYSYSHQKGDFKDINMSNITYYSEIVIPKTSIIKS